MIDSLKLHKTDAIEVKKERPIGIFKKNMFISVCLECNTGYQQLNIYKLFYYYFIELYLILG